MAVQPSWLTANQEIAYPFTEQIAGDVHRLLIDAVVYAKYDGLEDGEELFLTELDLSGLSLTTKCASSSSSSSSAGLLAATTIISNQNAVVVFDSGIIVPIIETFGQWTIIEWNDTAAEIIVRYIIDSSVICGYVYPINPVNAKFVARVWERNADTVQRVGVNGTWYDGDIKIAEGYNVDLAPSDVELVGTRRKNTVQLTGSAGAGLGRFTSCDPDDLEVKTINSMRADDEGDFKLEGDGCYWFGVPFPGDIPGSSSSSSQGSSSSSSYNPGFLSRTNHTIVMHNDCEACCKCEDYVEAYEIVRYVLLRARGVKGHVEFTKAMYDKGLTKWVAALAAREGDFTQVIVQSVASGYINVVTYLMNHTNADIVAPFGGNWVISGGVAWGYHVVEGSFWRYTDVDLWERMALTAGDPDTFQWAGGTLTLHSPTVVVPPLAKFTIKPGRVRIYTFQMAITYVATGTTITETYTDSGAFPGAVGSDEIQVE